MCTFISTFPKHSRAIGAPKARTNLEMFLQPCKDTPDGKKTYYRVRLLGIGSKVGRDDPHIVRMVHRAWTTDSKTGKKRLEKVVCTKGTPWIDTEGPKASSCKICNYVGQQWSIYRESGKTDVTARQKAGSCGTFYEAIVPVYVKNDPNYEKNNGQFKVIIFNDKEAYADFRRKADAKCREVPIFNGGKAADCLLHVSQVTETGKNGKQYKKTVIDDIKFSTQPTEVPAINAQNIDKMFPFDETYYSMPDEEDIDAFYNKFCAISNDDIPEDDNIPVYKTDTAAAREQPAVAEVAVNDTAGKNSTGNDDIDDIDALIDSNTSGVASSASDGGSNGGEDSSDANDIDTNDLFAELGI